MKYIYNLTYHIEEEVYPLWQEWIASRLEPLLRQSKCSAAKLLQIHTDALGSKAFGVQYEAEKKRRYCSFSRSCRSAAPQRTLPSVRRKSPDFRHFAHRREGMEKIKNVKNRGCE